MELRAEVEPRDACFIRNIRKCAVAIVVIEDVAPKLRDEQVRIPIVVVIPPDATEAITSAGNTRLIRDVGKGEIAIVAIKRVARGDSSIVQIAPVHKIDVLIAVAIIIGNTNAGAENFKVGWYAVVAAKVSELDSRRGSHVGELNLCLFVFWRSYRRILCATGRSKNGHTRNPGKTVFPRRVCHLIGRCYCGGPEAFCRACSIRSAASF